MNVGLLYTPVSIYQMTRGALVLFVGTFSVFFLRRRLWLYQSVISYFTGACLAPKLAYTDSQYNQVDITCHSDAWRVSRRIQRFFD